MTTKEIRERLNAIEGIVDNLVDEKDELMTKKEVVDKWSAESMEKRLRAIIVRQFGPDRIKLAVFKASSEYDDNWYTYHPSLTLVDADFNHIDNAIDLEQFIPDDDEQYQYYDTTGDHMMVKNLTIRF